MIKIHDTVIIHIKLNNRLIKYTFITKKIFFSSFENTDVSVEREFEIKMF